MNPVRRTVLLGRIVSVLLLVALAYSVYVLSMSLRGRVGPSGDSTPTPTPTRTPEGVRTPSSPLPAPSPVPPVVMLTPVPVPSPFLVPQPGQDRETVIVRPGPTRTIRETTPSRPTTTPSPTPSPTRPAVSVCIPGVICS